MSYQQESFGMMDEGYFVPRTQILSWINSLLQLDLTKIQQLGSGAVYCQIIDVIHPGKIPLSKVNWRAKNDYEFISNLKILQNSFSKIGIKRYVQVEKLSKAKYQDNLEFIQWLKRYYDVNCGDRGSNYSAAERRGVSEVNFGFAEKNVVPKTFNGAGQVKRSEGLERKKAQMKKEEIPVKMKSPSDKKIESAKKLTTPLQTITETATNSNIKTEKVENMEEKEKVLNQEIEYYKQVANKSQMKIEMMQQIMKTKDSAQIKMKMIEQILKE